MPDNYLAPYYSVNLRSVRFFSNQPPKKNEKEAAINNCEAISTKEMSTNNNTTNNYKTTTRENPKKMMLSTTPAFEFGKIRHLRSTPPKNEKEAALNNSEAISTKEMSTNNNTTENYETTTREFKKMMLSTTPARAAAEAARANNHEAEAATTNNANRLLGQLPIGPRVDILNFLGPEDLETASLVCKQMRQDCFRDGIKRKIVPVYVITHDMDHGAAYGAFQLFSKLMDNQIYKKEKFSRYPHLRVDLRAERVDYPSEISEEQMVNIQSDMAAFLSDANNSKTIYLDGVLSLDISMKLPRLICISFFSALLCLLPKLRKIDFSNVLLTNSEYLFIGGNPIFPRDSFLETIVYNGSTFTGEGHEFLNCNGLKELILDDSWFFIAKTRFVSRGGVVTKRRGMRALSNLDGHHKYFLFHICKSIERLSIRNATYYSGSKRTRNIPQNALIKFVRKAPASLRWFRSDLTEENIVMLQKERPEIELLN